MANIVEQLEEFSALVGDLIELARDDEREQVTEESAWTCWSPRR